MENTDLQLLSGAHKELVEFINQVDAPDIVKSLKRVYASAFFDQGKNLTEEQKDDLFYLEKIIRITQKL